MSGPSLVEFPAVPTVGLPMVVGEAHASVAVVCRCQSTNAPMIIRGVDVGAKCPACGRVYAITSIQFDRVAKPTMRLEVGLIGQHSQGAAS